MIAIVIMVFDQSIRVSVLPVSYVSSVLSVREVIIEGSSDPVGIDVICCLDDVMQNWSSI